MSVVYDLTLLGGSRRMTGAELTRMAAEAKTKVQSGRHGWERLSADHVIALAWLADVLLEDVQPDPKPAVEPKPAPPAIS